MTVWTKSKTDMALNLRKQGLGAKLIAKKLGPKFTRHTVLAKFHRIKENIKATTPSEGDCHICKSMKFKAVMPGTHKLTDGRLVCERHVVFLPVSLTEARPSENGGVRKYA